ncbi:HK97 family phage prohead protease [Macrococcus capreoli]|uniref:HK97 family phage prohead protease n=1 Tax=Macrococcus capreoli TaxID=2982690 RepID=UPI003F42CE44
MTVKKRTEGTQEIRTVNVKDLNTRAVIDDDGQIRNYVAEGYAAMFNSPTMISDWYEETIAPGAFTSSLTNDVRCLYNHDWSQVLGRTSSGTLQLREDDIGLYFEVTLPNTSTGRDLIEMLGRKDINQCSFGFVIKQAQDDFSDPNVLRTLITEVELYEVSIVALPAYADTSVSLRSKDVAEMRAKKIKLIKKMEDLINE